MEQVNKPSVIVEYEGVNIAQDISHYLVDTLYRDNVHGQADEIELTLNDSEGLFQKDWYPDKKSKLKVRIVHEGRELNCGTFFIDEIGYSFPPDVVKWRATSIDPNSKLRTKKSKNYSKVTLLQIAKSIAGNHGLTVDDGSKTVTIKIPKADDELAQLDKLRELFLSLSTLSDSIEFYSKVAKLIRDLSKTIRTLDAKGYAEVAKKLREGIGELLTNKASLEATESEDENSIQKIRRGAIQMAKLIVEVKAILKTAPSKSTRSLGLGLAKIMIEQKMQNKETDLEFLQRISFEYGLAFNIKPPNLVFYSAFHLDAAPTVVTIHKSGIITADLNDRTHGTYSDVNVTSHNPNTNETIKNGTELPNTAAQQGQLTFLSTAMKAAALLPRSARIAQIRQALETNKKILEGLKEKGFGEEFEALRGGFDTLFSSGTAEACKNFAKVCADLRSSLLKIQAEGNKVTSDKDAYAGGQSRNILQVRVKVETKDQADALAKAALYRANSETRTGTLTVPGNLLLVAGNNIDLEGVGRLSQKYNIVSSIHTITNGGEYTTTLDLKAGPVK